jgi:hydrogenase-1 operon protein HyaF
MTSDTAEDPAGPLRTGMAESLLREISRALAALAETGTRDAIDLRSLPLTPADRDELEQALGRGEVSVAFEIGGRSELWETSFAGVWWLRHLGAGDQIAAETIEITPLPDILTSHPDDIAVAAARLAETLIDPAEETAHV